MSVSLAMLAACRTPRGQDATIAGPVPAAVSMVSSESVLSGSVVDDGGEPVTAVVVRAFVAGELPQASSARQLAKDVDALVANNAAGLVAHASAGLAGPVGPRMVQAGGRAAEELASGLTDGQGHFRLALPPGRYNLEALGKPGFKGWLPGVAWGAAGVDAPLPILRLAATATLSGQVDILPVSGAPLPEGGEVLVAGSPYATPVLADGSFVLPDLPAGRLDVVVWQPGRGAVRYPPEGMVLLPSDTVRLPVIEIPAQGLPWRVVPSASPNVSPTPASTPAASRSPEPSASPGPTSMPSLTPVPGPTSVPTSEPAVTPDTGGGGSPAPGPGLATLEGRMARDEAVVAVAFSRAGHLAAIVDVRGRVAIHGTDAITTSLTSWVATGSVRSIALQQAPGSPDEDVYLAFADGRMERTRARTDGSVPSPDLVMQVNLSVPVAWAGPDAQSAGFWIGAGEVRHESAQPRESAVVDLGSARTTCGDWRDGRVLVGLDSGQVMVLDRSDGQRLAAWQTRSSPVLGLVIGGVDLRTGQGLILGTHQDGTMTLWSYPQGARIWDRAFPGGRDRIAMPPGGPLIAAVAEPDDSVRLIDLLGGGDKQVLQPGVGTVRALRFTPDGSRLWVVGASGASIWRMPSAGQ
ncbi:MAG: hypothetical protein VKO64_13085 [Candidatus Sericytochromatia bacterium]|nr:hypothetical protein [Candidatus Sericytochromatia bacterium]